MATVFKMMSIDVKCVQFISAPAIASLCGAEVTWLG